jgi:hypothetical protein
MVLYPDDTCILISGYNKKDFNIKYKEAFQEINDWFSNNILTLKFNKTQFMEFRTEHYAKDIMQSAYDLKGLTYATEVKFLVLTLDNTMSWNRHIEETFSKMCSACYALRNINAVVTRDTLRMIYYAQIHSFLSYGIILWGNSSYAKKVFTIQKKCIRIITDSKPTDSCRLLFKKLKIMTMFSQYFYSSIIHTVNKNTYIYLIKKFINTERDIIRICICQFLSRRNIRKDHTSVP